ncbi:putative protein isoform X3 [Capsicum chacoense]
MVEDDKDKGTANAPKKKLKKASMINRRSTDWDIKSFALRQPEIPTIDQSITHGQVYSQAGMRDMRNKLIIEPDGYGFNPDAAVRILSQIIQDLYRCAVTSWNEMPDNLRNQILLEFRGYLFPCSSFPY